MEENYVCSNAQQVDRHISQVVKDHIERRNAKDVESDSEGIRPVDTAPPKAISRVGRWAVAVLVIGSLCTTLVVSFLPFLWFSSWTNSNWHSIVARHYLTQVVTVLAEILKQTFTFEIGVVAAMLAAWTLERSQVSLGDAADLSVARVESSPGGLITLMSNQFKRHHRKKHSHSTLLFVLVTLAAAIFAFSQAITVILVNDLGLETVPGFVSTSELNVGFANIRVVQLSRDHTQPSITDKGSGWTNSPTFPPTIAEHSEPPVKQDGVSDTGKSLRAFLPFQTAQERQRLHSYNGRTTVVDSRVTCQVPRFESISFSAKNGYSILHMFGHVGASRNTPRLNSPTIQSPSNPNAMLLPFDCYLNLSYDTEQGKAESEIEGTSICQLQEDIFSPDYESAPMFAGGLVSEFQNLTKTEIITSHLSNHFFAPSRYFGVGYLILNATHGQADRWSVVFNKHHTPPPPQITERGEWLDIAYHNGSLAVSATLCFTSFYTADMVVNMTSSATRTEPVPTFNYSQRDYVYEAVRRLYGQNKTMTPAERGVMQLSRSDGWLATSEELSRTEPYIRDYANMNPARHVFPNFYGRPGNSSVNILAPPSDTFPYKPRHTPSGGAHQEAPIYVTQATLINPDVAFQKLFKEIIATGGDVAFALQTMLTVIGSMAYYSQVARFDVTAPVKHSTFITTFTPVQYWGLVSVLAVTVVHLVLVVVVLVMFVRGTELTMLGDSWQAVAHLISPATDTHLHHAASRKVPRDSKRLKREATQVSLGFVDEIGRPGLISVDSQGQSDEKSRRCSHAACSDGSSCVEEASVHQQEARARPLT